MAASSRRIVHSVHPASTPANPEVGSMNLASKQGEDMQEEKPQEASLEQDRDYWRDQAAQLKRELVAQRETSKKKAALAEQMAIDQSQLLNHIHQQGQKIEELTIRLSEQHSKPAPKHHITLRDDEYNHIMKENEQLRREKAALELQIKRQSMATSSAPSSDHHFSHHPKFDPDSITTHPQTRLPGRLHRRGDPFPSPKKAASQLNLTENMDQSTAKDSSHTNSSYSENLQGADSPDFKSKVMDDTNDLKSNLDKIENYVAKAYQTKEALDASYDEIETLRAEIEDLKLTIQKKNQSAEIYAFEKSSMMAKLESQIQQLEKLTMENSDLRYKVRLQNGQVSRSEMEVKLFAYEKALAELNQKHNEDIRCMSVEISQLREERDQLFHEIGMLKQNTFSRGLTRPPNTPIRGSMDDYVILDVPPESAHNSAPVLEVIQDDETPLSKPRYTASSSLSAKPNTTNRSLTPSQSYSSPITPKLLHYKQPSTNESKILSPVLGVFDFIYEIFWGSSASQSSRVHIV